MKRKLLPLFLLSSSIAAAQQPNIVMLFVDDLGWSDLGYQNSEFETPNIDKLKHDGLYFSRTYVSTATSSPSRASLLTGKEALRCGFVRHIYDNPDREEFQTMAKDPGHMKSRGWLPLDEITYAERLKEFGYYNYFVGKWHLGHEPYYPIHQGFDAMYGTCEHGHPNSYYQPFFKTENPFPDTSNSEYLTDKLTEGAVGFIEHCADKQPFLLNVWYYAVHDAHIGRKDLINKYLRKGMARKRAEYAAMVEAVDISVGRIRDAIQQKGLAGNTVFIFLSDQGGDFSNAPLRGGKRGGDTLAEGGSRVPLIIYVPGMEAMGQSYDAPVQTIDLYPTMVELASKKKCSDKQINGISLIPVLKGKKLKKRDLFLHRSYEDQNAAIIDGDWKLIKYRSGKLQLYNIKNDIGETTNLITVYPRIVKRMLLRLEDWQERATPRELLSSNCDL